MNINIHNLETIKISPSVALLDERMRYNESREAKIARAAKEELAELGKDKPTPLEKKATKLLRATLERLHENGAEFYVVPKDSVEAKRYDSSDEVGYATTISFVKGGLPQEADQINSIEQTIEALLASGILDVHVGFNFSFR